jgi:hypothetical protein
MLWLWALVAVVAICCMWQRREGLSPNAYEMAQLHQGDLDRLEQQLKRITLNREQLDEVKTNVQKTNDRLITLQKNIAKNKPNSRSDAYPK